MYSIPFLDLPPLSGAAGTVKLPGSKSISNRVLLLAGLAEGPTEIHELLDSDDTRVMLAALRQLGCALDHADGVLRVHGLGGRLTVHEGDLFLGNAGTAMRPLAAALAVLTSRQGGRFDLRGVPRMHERPIGDLVDALRQLGCHVEALGEPGYPPLRVLGTAGATLGIDKPIRVRGDVSSQFLSALLLALPLASEAGAITIEVEGELISRPYVEITLALLARFGVTVQREGWRRFTIPAHSRYRASSAIHVEGDASSASYFVALGALAATGAPIRIEGVGADSIQGDIRFIEAARTMGADVTAEANALEVRRGSLASQGHHARLQSHSRCGDDAGRDGAVRRWAQHADPHRQLARQGDRSHRSHDTELRKLGAAVDEGPDWIRVTPPARWHGCQPAHLRRPSHGHVRIAGRLQRAGRRGATGACQGRRPRLRRQDLPRLLRNAVRA